MGEELDSTLCTKVIMIMGSSIQGFHNMGLTAYPKRSKDSEAFMIQVFYEEDGRRDNIFEIDTVGKQANFWKSPKSYLTERLCMDLIGYLRSEGYEIFGNTRYFENPRFKKNEVSLY